MPHPFQRRDDDALPVPVGISRRRVLQAGGLLAAATALPIPWATPARAVAGVPTTLRQGTNVMVAASPDGRWLALDLVVSIWVLPAGGGPARRLTDDLQDAARPVWSPDGGTVAFQSYRDGNFHLWTVRADGGGLTQHTSGPYDHREPRWLPDGSGLLHSSDRAGAGTYDLHLLDLASGQVRPVTSGPGEDGEPTVSPDGARAAFTVDATRIDEVLLASGARRTLVPAVAGSSVYGPSYSPGSGRLAHVRLTGALSDLVVDGKQVTQGRDVFALPPSWLSDDELVYTADGRIWRQLVDGTPGEVPFTAVVPVQTRRPEPRRPDLDSTDTRQALGIASPVASRDGRQLAFRALNALWTADLAAGGRPRRLLGDGYFHSDPDFSPDGRSLLYASDRGGESDLWLRDLATGADRRVTALPGAQTAPRFSPDGRQVAYQDQDGVGSVLDLDTLQTRQVTPALFQPGRMSWSPDGRTLALAAVRPSSGRFREGTSQLLFVDVASGELEYVEPMPFRSLSTRGDDGPVFSPDGRHLAFVVESLLHVVPVGPSGRPTGTPRAVTGEVTDSPVWLDERTLLYLNGGRLRRTTIAGDPATTVPLDLTYTRARVREPRTIHAGRLWDGVAQRLRPDVDIVLDGPRIAAVRPHDPTRRPDVDAAGLTVMPGLIDAHNHWHLRGRAWGARQGLAWLSYGITTTRSPGDPAYQMQETREALTAGTLVGPRLFATGEAIDGSRVYYNFMRPTLSVEQLDLEVQRARRLRYDLVKTYVRLPVRLQRRAVQLAHDLGLRLTSHYLYPAATIGMDGMEHTGATNRLGYSHTVSRLGRAYDDVIALFTTSGMSITPTLFNSTVVHVDDPALVEDRRTRTLYPAWEYQLLLDRVAQAAGPAGATTRALLAGNVDMLLRISRGGGFVIAGTDAPLDNVAISLHANLRAMVGGGFTPYEALVTATRNPARWLGAEDRLGVVRPGAQADLSFVRGDPLADIRAAADVAQVMVGGRMHTVDDLLAPFDGSAQPPAAPALVRAPAGRTRGWRLGDHPHDPAHWWHEPEWLHRACCEG